MAHIFQAPNENKQIVDAAIEPIISEKRKAFESKRPIRLAIWLIVTVLCIGALALLLFKPGLMAGIRDTVSLTLSGWHDWLWAAGTDGKSIFHLALTLLCRLIALIVLLIYLLAPLLVPVVLIGGLGILTLIAITGLLATCSGFDEEAARKEVVSQLDDELQQLSAGVKGEEAALEAVSALGSECCVYANLVVWLDGHKNETDLIVVSPTGLTIVEVKNYSGTLLGDLSQPEITQRKYRKGGEYTEESRSNPVAQIDAPAYKLAQFLKRKGIAVDVRRCALFVHKGVTLKLTDSTGAARNCPVFLRESEEFLRYLHTPHVRTLSDQQIQQIVSALHTLL